MLAIQWSSVTRSGKFYAMLSIFRGAVNDPYAYLAPLHSGDADSGLGWYDAAFDAAVRAFRDLGMVQNSDKSQGVISGRSNGGLDMNVHVSRLKGGGVNVHLKVAPPPGKFATGNITVQDDFARAYTRYVSQ